MYPKLLSKSERGGRECMKTVTLLPKEKVYNFLFSAYFWSARQQLSLAGLQLSIPVVVVAFQPLVCVMMTSLYCPSSKDNDPEYVCAYFQKICTTKASLKRHLKATQRGTCSGHR